MANEKAVKYLKMGSENWNKWGRKAFDVDEIDLSRANFRKMDLSEVNLADADLRGVDLTDCNLDRAELRGANLTRANLAGANLTDADLTRASLTEANLDDAFLFYTVFIETGLSNTSLRKAKLESTRFIGLDLSETIGLKEVNHGGPCNIGMDTIRLSKGKIPEIFLRGCGLSDWEIESAKLYKPDLTNEEIVKIQYRIYDLRATRAIQISPLFISYSHADSIFVDRFEKDLNEKGVRFWRDIHDATAGRLETQIDRAIRQNPTVLLILSKNSIKSDWVEHEVRTARELGKELGRDALCPIALDDGWKSSPWPKRVMEQVMEYNILDFSDWEDKSAFEGKFAKLLNGLDLFYKKKDLS